MPPPEPTSRTRRCVPECDGNGGKEIDRTEKILVVLGIGQLAELVLISQLERQVNDLLFP